MNFSYERVSIIKQDEKRQELCLDSYKIDKKYIDKTSGSRGLCCNGTKTAIDFTVYTI